MNKIITIIFLTFCVLGSSIAQKINNTPIDQATINHELNRRGLEEEEVRVKLKARGIDVDNIDASQLPQLERALEEIVKELEEEKRERVEIVGENKVEKVAQEIAQDAGEAIQEAVEEGATVKEAIAEELVEQAQEEFPPSEIYGQQVFRNKSLKVFSQSKDVKPPPSYILGPGDKINISIWGLSQEDASYVVNEDGYIKPTGMSRISLKGISYKAAKKLLRSRFAQFYQFRPEEFEATITYSRILTVNIYGEVLNPGGYTLPATNTAFNALVACGGTTNIGSVRNIKLMRENGETKDIDVYKFMSTPTIQDDFNLKDNDVIFVSLAKKIVKIEGAVRRPMKYELLPNEELKSLIDYAGDLSVNAYTNLIKVKRYENNEEKIIDVKLTDLLKSTSDFKLINGDVVTIPRLPKTYDNFAKIEGAVEIPGEYEIERGMKVSDLIHKGIIAEYARRDVAFLIRVRDDGTASYEKLNIEEVLANPTSAANFLIRKGDRLNILSQKAYVDESIISTIGHLRNPREIIFDPNESVRVADAVLLSGGLKSGATDFAYIKRYNPNNPKDLEYIRINLVNALSDTNSSDNQVLQANDRLIVYSKQNFIDKSTISISGAVREPGTFTYDESLKLEDVLTMSGGFRLSAAKNRIDIFRVLIVDNEPTKTIVARIDVDDNFRTVGGDFDLKPFDQIVVRNIADFKMQRFVKIRGEVKYPGPYALTSDNERLSSLVERAGGLTGEAFPHGARLIRASEIGGVVMDLEEALSNPLSNFNFILLEGDELVIPKQKDLVAIKVANTRAMDIYPDRMLSVGQLNVPFEKGKRANFYINSYAAGFSEKAKRSSLVVEHPNGEIERTKNILFFRKYPSVRKGSVITLGRKKEKIEKEESGTNRDNTDWGKIVSNTIAQVTGLLTLILLVQRLD